jgi:hypothetical protein
VLARCATSGARCVPTGECFLVNLRPILMLPMLIGVAVGYVDCKARCYRFGASVSRLKGRSRQPHQVFVRKQGPVTGLLIILVECI